MIYKKKEYPHLHEFFILGGDRTEEGRIYARDNAGIINGEFIKISKIESHRDILGGDKNIHMPDKE